MRRRPLIQRSFSKFPSVCLSVCSTFCKNTNARDLGLMTFFSRYTLPCRSLSLSVRPSVQHISELRAVFALLLLPNRPRLSCCVSSLISEVNFICLCDFVTSFQRVNRQDPQTKVGFTSHTSKLVSSSILYK